MTPRSVIAAPAGRHHPSVSPGERRPSATVFVRLVTGGNELTLYDADRAKAEALAAALGGKVVVDIPNPLNETYDGLVTAPGTSAAETIRAALPAGANGFLGITLQGRLGTGFMSGWKLPMPA